MTAYQITLRESQTVGSWTTDRCRAVTTRKRDAAEVHAARLRDQCPRNSDLIKVEEIAAADDEHLNDLRPPRRARRGRDGWRPKGSDILAAAAWSRVV